MNRIPFKWILLLSLVGAIMLVLYWLKCPEPVLVISYTVEPGEVQQTVANTRVGTVKACRRAYLAPGTGGEVVNLNVSEGDVVRQGAVLLEVWNEGLKANVDLNKADIHSKQEAAQQACNLSAGSRRVAKRLQKLQQGDRIVSEETVDLAVTKAKAEQAACRSANARVKVSQANLQVAQAAVKRTQVRAPFDGTVAEVNAQLGEFVTPSPPGIPTLPAVDLLDLSCLYISAPIDEVDAPAIKIGMPACVSLDAFNNKRCSGKVSRIAPYVLEKEKQARTVEVEVLLQDKQDTEALMPGYSADIEVMIDRRSNVLRIPTEAILEDQHVLVLQEDGVLQRRKIKVGLRNWHFTEILEGLEAGEHIVQSVSREGVKAGIYAVAEQ